MLEVGPGAGAMTALMAAQGGGGRGRRHRPGDGRADRRGDRRPAERPGAPGRRPGGQEHAEPRWCSTTSAPGWPCRPSRRFKLVANLPYNVATPIVIEPARAPRALPGEDGGHDPARAGRADAGRAGDGRPTAPSRCWCRRWPTSSWCGSCPRRSSGRVRRSSRPSSRSRPTREARRDRRPALVPPGRPPGLPAPPQEPPPRPPQPLARPRWTKPEVDALLASIGLTGTIRAEAMNVEELRSLALLVVLGKRLRHKPDKGGR